MRAIVRKALADLRTYRLQSALIVLIVLGATATLTLAVTIRRGTDAPFERAFAEADGAHIWFFGRDAAMDWSPVASLEGVTGTSGPYLTTGNQILVHGAQRLELRLVGMPPELPAVGRPLVTEGRWLGAAPADAAPAEIVLDRNFARSHGLRVGEQITLEAAAGSIPFVVVGFALNVGRSPYPEWTPATAQVLPGVLSVIEPRPERVRSTFGVQLAAPETVDTFTANAYARYAQGMLLGTDDWQEVRADLVTGNQIYALLLGVFSVFALGAAGFVIANAIGGRVLAQFREIGLLKAVGFTPRGIVLLFLIEHLALALVAAVLGLALGAVLAPHFLRPTAELFNTTPSSAFAPLPALAILAAVALIVALFTLLPAWQGGRIATVQAITTGFARVQTRPSRLARLATRLRLPAPVVLGVKDAFARPLRALLTVAALTLTVITAIFSLGLETTLRDLLKDPAIFGDPFPMEVHRGERSDAELRQLLAGFPAIEGVFTRRDEEARAPGQAAAVKTRALEEPHDQFGFTIREGRLFNAPGEAVAGNGLLDLLGLKVGDQMQLVLNDRPLTLRIVGRYAESDEDGRTAMYSLETLRQQIDPAAAPAIYALHLAPGTDRLALAQALQRAAGGPLRLGIFSDETPAEVTQIRGILLGLNAVLLLIGLVNLLTTALLGVRERIRDFGILETIGLTPGQVTLAVCAGAGLLALLAVVVGIPLGLAVSRVLFDELGRQTGIGTGVGRMPALWWLALVLAATVLLAVLGSLLPARRAAGVQVAEVLRYE